ncbi:MAG: hypothetical protein H6807_13105 [Planctomycetes bacterium]|nr:hypothetical protein [Planctomycetota bacterium]
MSRLTLALLLMLAVLTPAQTIQSQRSGRWSDPGTWSRLTGNGALPGPGDAVLIQPGHRLLLDTNQGLDDLAHLDLRGQLAVEDRRDYRLEVSRIDIGRGGAGGARLRVGTPARPFGHRFVVVLDDRYLSPNYGDPLEHLSFMVHPGATLTLQGQVSRGPGLPIRSWLRLAEGPQLEVGATRMVLEEIPGWRRGDEIVIASTDFDMTQAEVLRIKAVNGRTIDFSPPLRWSHHAGVEFGVDERAEVGLLRRNIVVRSSSQTARRGGHLMAMRSGSTHGNLQLGGVELRGLGWYGALGRYPVHWHLCGTLAADSNWLRNCSIHDCFNRAVTIHQTNGAVVEDCVIHDTWGHAVYLEDRVEVDNLIRGNLGLLTRRPDTDGQVAALGDIWPTTGQPFFRSSDLEPSTFWITRARNTIVGNVAAGSAGHGIWYDPDIAAPLQSVGTWQDNVCHSNEINGFHQEDARPFAYDPSRPNALDGLFRVSGLRAWKNRQAGIWNRCYGQALFEDVRLADNRIGVYFSSEGIQHDSAFELGIGPVIQQLTSAQMMSAQVLRDAVIVGESSNRGNPRTPVELAWPGGPRSLPVPSEPQWELKGVEIYDGFIGVEDTVFRNFRDAVLPQPVTRNGETFALRPAAALASRGERSTLVPGIPWGVDPRNMVRGLDLDQSVDHPALFAIAHAPVSALPGQVVNAPPGAVVNAGNGLHATMIYDLDGSLGGLPETYWVTENPLLLPLGTPPAPRVGPHHLEPLPVPGPATFHGGECFAQLLINIANDAGTSAITYIRFTAEDRANGQLDVYEIHGSSASEGRRNYVTTLLCDAPSRSQQPFERYRLDYPPGHQAQDDPRDFVLKFQFGENERHVMLSIPYHGGPPSSIVCYPEVDPQRSLYAYPIGAPDLNAALPIFDDGIHDEWDYYYDAANERLILKPTLYDPNLPSGHWLLDGRSMIMDVRG